MRGQRTAFRVEREKFDIALGEVFPVIAVENKQVFWSEKIVEMAANIRHDPNHLVNGKIRLTGKGKFFDRSRHGVQPAAAR